MSSGTDSDASEQTAIKDYCIFLHIVEGIDLRPANSPGDNSVRRKDTIFLTISLNGVKFDVEGYAADSKTIFNSNCVWECTLEDVKKMKLDNRPIKVDCFVRSGDPTYLQPRTIGSLLLPIRGIPTVYNLKNAQLKFHWHKLGALRAQWREHKPELSLILIVVKKEFFYSGELESLLVMHKPTPRVKPNANSSATLHMLQSQNNLNVKLLEALRAIQLGNNVDVNTPMFKVSMTFRSLKDIRPLITAQRIYYGTHNHVLFVYDFLGNVIQHEVAYNPTVDFHIINEKLNMNFKSTLANLRDYYTKIFYIPITLKINGVAMATVQLNFSKFLPSDNNYYNTNNAYINEGDFRFDDLVRKIKADEPKPMVNFMFKLELVKENQSAATYSGNCTDRTESLSNFDSAAEAGNCGSLGFISSRKNVEFKIGKIEALQINLDFRPSDESDARKSSRVGEVGKCANVTDTDNNSCNDNNNNHNNSTNENCDNFDKPNNHDIVYLKYNENGVNNSGNRYTSPRGPNVLIKDACVGPEFGGGVSIRSIAINTDVSPPDVADFGCNTETTLATSGSAKLDPEETEELVEKVVEELEEWKAQQMDNFLCELERRQKAHLTELDKQWQQQRVILHAKLDAKTSECEALSAKLANVQAQLQAKQIQCEKNERITEAIKREIETTYAQKFDVLDSQMQKLKVEMLQQSSVFQKRNREIQHENERLENEKMEFLQRIEQLENELKDIRKTHVSSEQLQNVIADMRAQTERYAGIEKTRDYYKEQWAKTTREINSLKLELLQLQEEKLKEKQKSKEGKIRKNSGYSICLQEILSEERDELYTERSELKSVKDLLLSESEASESELNDDECDE